MTMLFIALVAACLICGILRSERPPKKTDHIPPQMVTVEWCKEQERQRKEAAQKAQAQRDIETATATINDLDLLMDAAQRRYDVAEKDKDAEKALRQIMALRKQIATAERKIEKAKYIVKYGG